MKKNLALVENYAIQMIMKITQLLCSVEKKKRNNRAKSKKCDLGCDTVCGRDWLKHFNSVRQNMNIKSKPKIGNISEKRTFSATFGRFISKSDTAHEDTGTQEMKRICCTRRISA